ncbi:hypothetical protein T01_11152 [Trichinella spiralis]|uniref:Uncharacterized protein n=1 Tax=Trichinella spiralis TaxID=6334 RepID=A0A0V1AWN6_TRISP|nr:hypothetical protein T01_11152 [Trichinella spiralis]
MGLNAAQGKKQNRCRKYTGKNAAVHPPAWKLLQLEIPAYWRVTKSGRLFFTYNSANDSILIFCTEENLRELATHSVWCRDGTFKIVPECLTVRKHIAIYCEIFDNLIAKEAVLRAVFQAQTIICDFETALIPAVQGSFPGVHVPSRSGNKEKITMLMATAFLPLAEVPDAVDLLCRDLAETPKNNHLEGCSFKMNQQEGKRHLSFYELLRLLIDEQGSTETLIQQVTSGSVTVNDLRVKNNKYEEVQLRITALTAEYDGGTRIMEQFLRLLLMMFRSR